MLRQAGEIRVIATKSDVRPFMDRKGRDIWKLLAGLTRLALNLKRARHNRAFHTD